jgi:hypothetical protein
MGCLRLGPAGGALGSGIAFHHATDHAFHSDDWFLDLGREMREALHGDGLPDGAARACAHVGPELLLDGALLIDVTTADGVTEVWGRIGAPGNDVVDLAPPGERERWRVHLESVATRLDPFSYSDAQVVARRLHAITSRRPRLAFDGALVGVVTRHMAAVQPRIMASAPQILERVCGAIARHHRRGLRR